MQHYQAHITVEGDKVGKESVLLHIRAVHPHEIIQARSDGVRYTISFGFSSRDDVIGNLPHIACRGRCALSVVIDDLSSVAGPPKTTTMLRDSFTIDPNGDTSDVIEAEVTLSRDPECDEEAK